MTMITPNNQHALEFLVAHRGDRVGGVENTLAAFAKAAASGARWMECDIHFSSDWMPVVFHDSTLDRLCHHNPTRIADTPFATLTEQCSSTLMLPTLHHLMQWLEEFELCCFIEVKPPILERLSATEAAKLLAKHLPESLRHRLVLISESVELLEAFASHMNMRIGWVAESSDMPTLPLDFVFMPYTHAEQIPSWHARGTKVALYTVNDAQLARDMREAGADLIETDCFTRMRDELG